MHTSGVYILSFIHATCYTSYSHNLLFQNAPNRFVILLVGTTSVHEDKEVQQEVVEEFAHEHNVQYFECVLDGSGPSGTAEIFTTLVDKIMENFLATGKQIGGEYRHGTERANNVSIPATINLEISAIKLTNYFDFTKYNESLTFPVPDIFMFGFFIEKCAIMYNSVSQQRCDK